MLKQILAELNPSITDLLPHGAIDKIADKYLKSRQTISNMLRGKTGKEEYVLVILQEAINIAKEEKVAQDKLVKTIKTVLEKSTTVTS